VIAKHKKPTVTLIAKKCGMSKMTVSRVLRNHPSVSPATRDFILRTAEKVGFKPSGSYPASRDLVRDYCILFQSAYSEKDAFFSRIISTVQQELFARGLNCSLGVIEKQFSHFLKLNQILCSRGVRGVFVVGEISPQYADVLQTNFLNLVFIDCPGDQGIDKPYNAVCVDNVYGAHLALNHLFKLGRRRILLICGRQGHYFSDDLLEAYRESLARRQIELDPSLVVYADFHVKGGFAATKRVLEARTSFDAIFSNDEMACGAMKALQEAGFGIPTDISVVGFDGLEIGEVVSPALTTVVIDRESLGRLAVQRLLAAEQETGDSEKFESISLFPKLLIRASCGASPAPQTSTS
jgi:DNA-binding LacI/PurR family transcriptional regulator